MKLIIIRVVLIASLTFFLKFLVDGHFDAMDVFAPIILILGLLNERKIYFFKKQK